MKTKVVAASAILVLFLLGAVSVSFAHSGLLMSSQSTNPMDGDSDRGDNQTQRTTLQNSLTSQSDGEDNQVGTALNNLTIGNIITVPSKLLMGHFVSVNNPLQSEVASGTFTFQVTQVFQTGITAAIISGHITLGGVTFNVTSGRVIFTPDGESGVGSGTAGSAHFIIQIHGSTSASDAVRIDMKTGTNEFLVTLGNSAISGDSSGGFIQTSSGGSDGSGGSDVGSGGSDGGPGGN